MTSARHARRREFPTSTETRVIAWLSLAITVACPFVPLLPWLR